MRTENVKPWQTEEVTTILHIPESEYGALLQSTMILRRV